MTGEEAAIKKGKYRHYKGGEYEVLGVCRHSETLEDIVVYRALYPVVESISHYGVYGEGDLWARPLKMFLEKVEVNGKMIPRFEYLGFEHLDETK